LFGPSGSGKGIRILAVNLLSDCLNDRSVIVIDPKGELAAMTALYRRKILGHEVQIIDPFGKLHEVVKDSHRHKELVEYGLTKSAGFNPLGNTFDPELQNFFDNAANLADALIKVEQREPHWTESAQGLSTALIMWEKMQRKNAASLGNVRRMLTEADDYTIAPDENDVPQRTDRSGLLKTAKEMVEHGGEAIASLASRFTRMTNEIAGIRSAADTQTRWLLSPAMSADLRIYPGIDFARLKVKKTTVYVILPSERLRTHSVWLRLVIVSALNALYRPGGLRVAMLVDEMAALGHLGPLEDAIGLVRGYRVQILGVLQDLPQLKALYGERWESFLANAGFVQFFAPNDKTTAEWMSWRSGQKTVTPNSVSETTSFGPGGESVSENRSFGESARAHYLPHELFGFIPGAGLLWMAGMENGVRFFAPRYENMRDCDKRWLPSPYYSA